MQDEVNEKTIALYIKTGKLTAQTLQKAMKAILSKGKKQLAKPPQGKQSLKQLMKQNAGVSNIEIRFLYKGIIIKHNKTEPTYTKTSLFLCEKRRFFMARTEKGVVATI